MKKTINIFLLIFSFVLLQNCEEEQFESSLKYVSFALPSYQTSIDPGSTASQEITIYASTMSNSERVYNLKVDEELTTGNVNSYSLPESVTIPSGSNKGTFTIVLTDSNLDCSNDLVFNLDPKEGNNPGPSSKLTYYQKPSSSCNSEVSGTLDFVFDSYASEISYQILDVEGNVVVSGPSAKFSDGDTEASIPVTLCSGRCYTLVIKDSYGDGLATPGSFTLTIDGVEYASGGGNFGKSKSIAFQLAF